jgi:hypothetical protein
VVSTGSGLTARSSCIVTTALDWPLLSTVAWMSSTAPTRVPPMRTSLPTTSEAARGSSALIW